MIVLISGSLTFLTKASVTRVAQVITSSPGSRDVVRSQSAERESFE